MYCMKYSYVLNNFKNFTFCTSIPSSDLLYIHPHSDFFCTLHPHSDFFVHGDRDPGRIPIFVHGDPGSIPIFVHTTYGGNFVLGDPGRIFVHDNLSHGGNFVLGDNRQDFLCLVNGDTRQYL